MFLPIRTEVPLRTTPWANRLIILLNVGAFIGQLAHAPLTGMLQLDGFDPAVWQFVTYQFAHSTDGVLHLAGNMLFLWIFGNAVCDKMGSVAFAAFYLSGGVMAGLAHVLIGGGPVIGASGSVAAVTGAYIVLFPWARVKVLYLFILIGVIEVPGLILVGLYFVLDIMTQVNETIFGASSGVAAMAHIGGTVYGFTIALILLATGVLGRSQYDLFSSFKQAHRRRQFKGLSSSGWNAQTGKVGRAKVDPRMEQVQDLRASISAAIAHNKPDDAAGHYLELIAIDPQQVLSRTTQQDVANQLFRRQRHRQAAEAYEKYIAHYGTDPRADVTEIRLLLGLIYARYLSSPADARSHLTHVVQHATDPSDRETAEAELRRLVETV